MKACRRWESNKKQKKIIFWVSDFLRLNDPFNYTFISVSYHNTKFGDDQPWVKKKTVNLGKEAYQGDFVGKIDII